MVWRYLLVSVLLLGCGNDSDEQLEKNQQNATGAPWQPNSGEVDPQEPASGEVSSNGDAAKVNSEGPAPAEEQGNNFCELWERDYTAENISSITRFALSQATAVIEGKVLESTPLDDYHLHKVRFLIQKVWYGWSFLEGMQVQLRLDDELLESLFETHSLIIALSLHHPSDCEDTDLPCWGKPLVTLPGSQRDVYAQQLKYRANDTPQVAVVKIVEQDEYRTTFEVIDALKGTLPKYFSAAWYASWQLPYPGISSSELHPELSNEEFFIASLYGLTEYPSSGEFGGTVIDFRPATQQQLDIVTEAIAQSTVRYDIDQLAAAKEMYLKSFRLFRSPFVVSSVVTGMAFECCTGAGGTFFSHDILEFISGTSQTSRFVTGGHAYYGTEGCGDAFLMGLTELNDPTEQIGEGFDCITYPDGNSYPADGPQITSAVCVRLPFTPENQARVQDWVTASPPVYQLLPPEAEVAADDIAQDLSNAPWSVPLDAAQAFLMGTHLVLFIVEEVTHHQEQDFYEVTLSTTFSRHEFDHLVRHYVKIAFRCGDQRLLQPGSRWIGAFVLQEPFSYHPDDEPDLSEAFLLPGALVPEWAMTDQLASVLEFFLR